MTKAELIERVYGEKHLPRDLTKKTVAQIVDAVFTEMGDYFIRTRVIRNQGARLTYPGFGTFSKRRRPPRMVPQPPDRRADHDSAAGDDHLLARPGAALAAQPQRQGVDGKSGGAPRRRRPRALQLAVSAGFANTRSR